MPTMYLVESDHKLCASMTEYARKKGFDVQTCVDLSHLIVRLSQSAPPDIISISTPLIGVEGRAEGVTFAQFLAHLKNNAEFRGTVVHYRGQALYDDIGVTMSGAPFSFVSVEKQCYGTPECPLYEWWGDRCWELIQAQV